jgi:hypothetical protein
LQRAPYIVLICKSFNIIGHQNTSVDVIFICLAINYFIDLFNQWQIQELPGDAPVSFKNYCCWQIKFKVILPLVAVRKSSAAKDWRRIRNIALIGMVSTRIS